MSAETRTSLFLLLTIAVFAYYAWLVSGELELLHTQVAELKRAEDARKRRRKPAAS